jgi:hypothetical protein
VFVKEVYSGPRMHFVEHCRFRERERERKKKSQEHTKCTFFGYILNEILFLFPQKNPDADKRMRDIADQHKVHDTLYL